MPVRYDRNAPIRRPVRHDSGFLRVEAHLTRTGVFEYQTGDGKVRRELRLASEVFKQDALESFAGVPVTDEHPPVMLSPANSKKYTVGAVGEQVKQDGELVLASMAIHDSEAIKKVESGEATEVSCGYHCDLEEVPGTWNGQKYDAIQKNIRGNHVAIVPKGRAGREARIHLDAADAFAVPEQSTTTTVPPGRADGQQEHTTMEKVFINGIWVEVSATAKQALEAEKARADEAAKKLDVELKAARADAEKEKGRADGLKTELEKAEAARKDAADPTKLQAAIKARVSLENTARKVLGKDAKLDGLDDKAIKLKVLAKVSPSAKYDSKSDAYVDGAFELAAERAAARADADDEEREDGDDELPEGLDQLTRTDADEDEHLDGDETPAWMKVDVEKSRKGYLQRMDALSSGATAGTSARKSKQ